MMKLPYFALKSAQKMEKEMLKQEPAPAKETICDDHPDIPVDTIAIIPKKDLRWHICQKIQVHEWIGTEKRFTERYFETLKPFASGYRTKEEAQLAYSDWVAKNGEIDAFTAQVMRVLKVGSES